MSKKRRAGRKGHGDPGTPQRPSSLREVEAGGLSAREALAAWLPGQSPRAALAAVADGDPLGIEERARQLIGREAWLLDVERLVARGLAAVAFAAHRYNGFPDLDRWVDQELARAARALLEQDRETVQEGRAIDLEDAPNFRFLAETLGLSIETTVHAAVVFNGLPADVRRCWYGLAIAEMSVADCVAAGWGDAASIEARARRAMLAMSLLADPGGGRS